MATPSASYSLTIRVVVPSAPGSFAQVAAAIGAAGGDLGAIDLVRAGREGTVRDVTVNAGDSDHGKQIVDAVRALPGVDVQSVSDRTFLLHLGGKIEVTAKSPHPHPRRSLDGLHAGRRARLPRDRRRSRARLVAHHQAQHRRRRLRRDGRARARRHRPRGGDARDGGQGDAVQGVRRHRRVPALPRHEGRRRDRAHRQGGRAGLRRDQPRGHLGAALLRDRAPPARGARHPGLPRRPARHGGRRARRLPERPAGRRQATGGRQGRDDRRRRGRHRVHEDPARRRRPADHRRRPRGSHPPRPRAASTRRKRWYAENTNAEGFAGHGERGAARRGRVHRAVRPREPSRSKRCSTWPATRSSSPWPIRPPRCRPRRSRVTSP